MTASPAGAGGSDGRAYLDHASTSPVRPAALEAMLPWMSAVDPGRVHTEGRMARVALEEAREAVASFFGTRPRQVIFASGATEAINASAYGALGLAQERAWAAGGAEGGNAGARSGPSGGRPGPPGGRPGIPGRRPGSPGVALAAVEHSAVRE